MASTPRSTVGGGVEDFYSEDYATEELLVTPWTVSVARYSAFVAAPFLASISSFAVVLSDLSSQCSELRTKLVMSLSFLRSLNGTLFLIRDCRPVLFQHVLLSLFRYC